MLKALVASGHPCVLYTPHSPPLPVVLRGRFQLVPATVRLPEWCVVGAAFPLLHDVDARTESAVLNIFLLRWIYLGCDDAVSRRSFDLISERIEFRETEMCVYEIAGGYLQPPRFPICESIVGNRAREESSSRHHLTHIRSTSCEYSFDLAIGLMLLNPEWPWSTGTVLRYIVKG